ncbi:MAG: class A beta-lactamase-related serine hydrolase [Bryobacteraceae bacterium]|nr:class A beta-lactamase-related serine hydrolase [Bryobacteraceae bacterium]
MDLCRRSFLCLPAAVLAQPALPGPIRREIEGFDGDVYFYARHLGTGESIGWRENERVRTASTIKLPIMAAVFHKVRAGEARWDEPVELREQDKVSGSGVLRELSHGVKLPLRDLVRLMIVVSDNTATNLVLDRIPADAVNEFLDTLGLKQTRALRKVRGDGTDLKAPSGWSRAGLLEENRRFGLGVSTPREMVELMALLDAGKVVSAEDSREMLAILERQQYKDGIGRKLAGFRVASKSGALDALRSDVGLVTTPKAKVAMAITVDGMKQPDWTEDNPGLLLIARLARLLAEHLGAV